MNAIVLCPRLEEKSPGYRAGGCQRSENVVQDLHCDERQSESTEGGGMHHHLLAQSPPRWTIGSGPALLEAECMPKRIRSH
jgi:hypothetical protein